MLAIIDKLNAVDYNTVTSSALKDWHLLRTCTDYEESSV